MVHARAHVVGLLVGQGISGPTAGPYGPYGAVLTLNSVAPAPDHFLMRKRDLPVAITNRLGLRAIDGIDGPWLSNEDTVIQEWFQAVAELLGLPYSTKVATMKRILAHFDIPWNAIRHASTEAPQGGGGNVRKEAFEDLLSAIEGDPRAPVLATVSAGTPFLSLSRTSMQEDARILRAIRTRRGQPNFRQRLLTAYDGRCALTGWDAPASLEAAHIRQHCDGGDYSTRNGVLLRADLHTLFDLGLLGIDDRNGEALLHPELQETSYDIELATAVLRLPQREEDRPDWAALREHNLRAGLIK